MLFRITDADTHYIRVTNADEQNEQVNKTYRAGWSDRLSAQHSLVGASLAGAHQRQSGNPQAATAIP